MQEGGLRGAVGTEKMHILVNGRTYDVDMAPQESLNHVLREKLGLTGTKMGCDTGGCGSCTVVVDGRAVYSCMMFAYQAIGKSVVTVEGLQSDGELHPIQHAFVENGGLQCGYCTPGFLMSTYALLLNKSEPTDSEIRDALVGNICRCTGYIKIIQSVKAGSKLTKPDVKEKTKL
ncbi:MAG TPA: (2Fe-2S)-binding protein [Nitrososphaerales archaeon]|nr:(2Fe-2S)-binding protein [Nitrososphaerales archaeon]